MPRVREFTLFVGAVSPVAHVKPEGVIWQSWCKKHCSKQSKTQERSLELPLRSKDTPAFKIFIEVEGSSSSSWWKSRIYVTVTIQNLQSSKVKCRFTSTIFMDRNTLVTGKLCWIFTFSSSAACSGWSDGCHSGASNMAYQRNPRNVVVTSSGVEVLPGIFGSFSGPVVLWSHMKPQCIAASRDRSAIWRNRFDPPGAFTVLRSSWSFCSNS